MIQRDLFAIERPKNLHDRARELISSVEIENAIMQVFTAEPDRTFKVWHIIDAVRRFDAGDCAGHILGRLARAGRITEEPVYFGSDHPAKPNYQGFSYLYKLASTP